MTYISRKTRIIVSRWLDECDVEYKLRACRNRSEGRLKKHTSCDDLRAWVNNYCENHEHLVELMSDGEATGKSRVRLYGRYIPIPALFKIIQNVHQENIGSESKERHALDKNLVFNEKEKLNENRSHATSYNKAVAEKQNKLKDNEIGYERNDNNNGNNQGNDDYSDTNDEENGSHNNVALDKENIFKIQREKFLLEKRFFECSSLLCKAISKLEKIDSIVCNASNESENARNEEIQLVFRNAKSVCSCYVDASVSHSNTQLKPYTKSITDTFEYKELHRKISNLCQELLKVKHCRIEINEQIQIHKNEKYLAALDTTKKYSREKEAELNCLQKRLKRLIDINGKIVMDLTEAVISLIKYKKSFSKSKSQISSLCNSKSNITKEDEFHCVEPVICACGCQCTDNFDSSDSSLSEKVIMDDGGSTPRHLKNDVGYSQNKKGKNYLKCEEYKEMQEEKKYNEEALQSDLDGSRNENLLSNKSYPSSASNLTILKNSADQKGLSKSVKENKEEGFSKTQKTSKIKFVCPERNCKKKKYSESLENYQNTYVVEQKQRGNPFENIANPRPNTSPMPLENNSKSRMPVRKIKSETTMQEIEKALRNYERRLKNLDYLENKIEKLRQNLFETNRLRQECMKQKNQSKIRAVEMEKSSREINKLCLENRELSKKVQNLTAKSSVQCKKLQEQRRKVKTLEEEAEQLRKDLIECQNSFNNQLHCINILESVVANQRTEIEKLTNLIITPKSAKAPVRYVNDKNVQRSRSYSPKSIKAQQVASKPCLQSMSSEDNDTYYYEMPHQQDMRTHRRSVGEGCCRPLPTRRRDWCAN